MGRLGAPRDVRDPAAGERRETFERTLLRRHGPRRERPNPIAVRMGVSVGPATSTVTVMPQERSSASA
jgi:hypothetical protein